MTPPPFSTCPSTSSEKPGDRVYNCEPFGNMGGAGEVTERARRTLVLHFFKFQSSSDFASAPIRDRDLFIQTRFQISFCRLDSYGRDGIAPYPRAFFHFETQSDANTFNADCSHAKSWKRSGYSSFLGSRIPPVNDCCWKKVVLLVVTNRLSSQVSSIGEWCYSVLPTGPYHLWVGLKNRSSHVR
jgi:hypothetical protein